MQTGGRDRVARQAPAVILGWGPLYRWVRSGRSCLERYVRQGTCLGGGKVIMTGKKNWSLMEAELRDVIGGLGSLGDQFSKGTRRRPVCRQGPVLASATVLKLQGHAGRFLHLHLDVYLDVCLAMCHLPGFAHVRKVRTTIDGRNGCGWPVC